MAKKQSKRARAGAKAKGAKRGKGKASSRRKATPSVAAAIESPTSEQTAAAAKRYSSSVVARGEAVPAAASLPPGATHEIVGKEPDGTPVIKRRRFSAV